jgi:hypothetical protein
MPFPPLKADIVKTLPDKQGYHFFKSVSITQLHRNNAVLGLIWHCRQPGPKALKRKVALTRPQGRTLLSGSRPARASWGERGEFPTL